MSSDNHNQEGQCCASGSCEVCSPGVRWIADWGAIGVTDDPAPARPVVVTEPARCRLGHVGYEGDRYCHEHAAFTSHAAPHARCSEANEQWSRWRESLVRGEVSS